MDFLKWDGKAGSAGSGNTKMSLMMNPIPACEAINYDSGAGTMTVDGIVSPIDAQTIALIEAYLKEVVAFDSAPPAQGYGVDADGNYLGMVPVTQAAQILSQPLPSGQTWTQTSGKWAAAVPLLECQQLASAEIDQAAGSARLRYITDVAGQQAVYIEKLQQAQAWVASPTGTPPPYIGAEAAAMNTDATTAANTVLATAEQWNGQLSPAIEGARRSGKIAVTAATTNAEVLAAKTAAITVLNDF